MKKTSLLMSFIVLCSLILTACGPAATPGPTAAPTQAVDTAATSMAATMSALSKEVANLKATNAALAVTPTAAKDGTPAGTQKAPGGTPTPAVHAAGVCDYAAFVGDITIPDGTTVPPNTPFTKTWAIKNTGSCTWTPDYTLVYSGGDLIGAPMSVPLTTKNVLPGETAQVSINFTAPADLRIHRSYWKMKNASGGVFGVTDATGKEQPIWTEIMVSNTYDFLANMCSATWKTGSGTILPCNGDPNKTEGGAVYRMNNSQWEGDVIENEPVLVMVPPAGSDTTIIGQFPPVVVPDFSRLQTRIGCLRDQENCNVHIKITYSVDGGPEQPLYETDQAYDGDVDKLDVRMIEYQLFKQSTSFIFYVTAVGDASQDKIFFFVPKLAP